ncbi:uncharacterized protein LOC130628895 isoform X2 [Hydractinia symbiolongicarpus]|nr:uncharacterized protein LOC130628895 isoform X2 [Hydractinia symbiolongicarpus]
MNLEEIIKEYDKLKFESTNDRKNELNKKKSFPHIVSKESFEQMIMSADPDAVNDNRITTILPADSSVTNSPEVSTPKFQQTSVITSSSSVRKKSSEQRRRSIHRQRNIDDSANIELPKNSVITEERFSHMRKDHVTHANRYEAPQYRAYSPVPEKSHIMLKSRSLDVHPGMHKSKSLDIDHDLYQEYAPRASSFPLGFTKALSFNEDQGTHISYLYKDSHGSLQNSSRESFSDSPNSTLNNSPISSSQTSPLRRLQETQGGVIPDGTNMQNKSRIALPPGRYSNNQQMLQYKYSQRKAYSLNTAPYDVVHRDKSLRRIFSEEIVPEYPLSDQERKTKLPTQHMRRAASYDLGTYLRYKKNISGSDVSIGNYQTEAKVKASTKIIFPEHDNVKDYKNIFVKPIEDEAMNAMNIHQMMEKSNLFNAKFDVGNYFPNTTKNFNDEEKLKKKGEQMKTKIKTQQPQQDGFTIGPYHYDPQTDDEVAVYVSGLLTLPGSNERRYPITVGELRRRIAPPEFLNKVDMISYVRLAKTSARELLEKHAIRPKHHSRKSKHSVISKMCEAECTELANGIKALSDAYFPKEWLASKAVAEIKAKSREESREERDVRLQKQKEKIESARTVLSELTSLLEENKSEKEMQNYSLATHSYGMQSLTNNIDLISNLLQSQIDNIDKRVNTSNELKTEEDFGNDAAPMETDQVTSNSPPTQAKT